ncbi:MAG: STAS domain-containing protein [Clostridia bacterium]|nr:STAS domain-containing protein [Clostridia bacterium]
MNINFEKNAENLTISLDGHLDTATAPELEEFLNTNLQGVKSLTVDCQKLTYVSSAGLRVLLSLQKKMRDSLQLINVGELVMEIFEITGFVDILTIK